MHTSNRSCHDVVTVGGRVAGSATSKRPAPQLVQRLRHARRTSPVGGMLGMLNQVRQAFGPGWALVGDAGYHRDAVTGYGISDAIRDAELLAVAVDQALRAAAEEARRSRAISSNAIQALRETFEITWPFRGLSGRADVHRASTAEGSRTCENTMTPSSSGVARPAWR